MVQVPIPIDVGEQDWNLFTFRDFIAHDAVQVCAADITKCGGYGSMKRVATLCRAFGVSLSPHNTSKSIGMAASLQFIASSPECNSYHEFSIEPKSAPNYLINEFKVENGLLQVPDKPGLGVELDIELIEKTMEKSEY